MWRWHQVCCRITVSRPVISPSPEEKDFVHPKKWRCILPPRLHKTRPHGAVDCNVLHSGEREGDCPRRARIKAATRRFLCHSPNSLSPAIPHISFIETGTVLIREHLSGGAPSALQPAPRCGSGSWHSPAAQESSPREPRHGTQEEHRRSLHVHLRWTVGIFNRAVFGRKKG